MIDSSSSTTSIHASAVVLAERGILIRGESGRGKSALALALIELADELGLFGRLIGDDLIQIRVRGGRIVMNGASNVRGLIERRGFGLARVLAEQEAVAHLVVDLLDADLARMPDEAEETCELAGVLLPRIAFDGLSRPRERARTILSKTLNCATGL